MCGQLSFCSRRSHTPRPIPAQDGPRPPSGGCRYQAEPGNGCGAPDAPLPLALLVPRVGADDHDAAMPANDPAFAADLLNARLDLHPVSFWAGHMPGYFVPLVCLGLVAPARRGPRGGCSLVPYLYR